MPRSPVNTVVRAEFGRNRPLQAMIVWLAVVWGLAAWEPVDRFDWMLENLLVFVYGAILVASYRRFTFSNLSYLLFTVFMTLHLIGSHYTYAEVPVGFWLRDHLDLARNPYDRIVHFSYGLLIAYPFREILVRAAQVAAPWVTPLAVVTVLAFSAAFEVIEAVIAMLVSPEQGDAYLGTQGDIWDAQWDMGLALFGAVLAMALRAITRK